MVGASRYKQLAASANANGVAVSFAYMGVTRSRGDADRGPKGCTFRFAGHAPAFTNRAALSRQGVARFRHGRVLPLMTTA